MKKILVVGKNSFLASNFIKRSDSILDITSISHWELESVDFESFSCVVNMAYHPTYFKTPYFEENDFDLRVAKALVGKPAHYFMMSTRKVYGVHPPFPATEDAPLVATDFYGKNKSVTEVAVRRLLGAQCTVLRLANIFGDEAGRHTFFGIALANLKQHNRIVLDVSPFTLRDFLPVLDFSDMLVEIIQAAPSGVFNLGSSITVPVGQIALWVIEGFGSGELMINTPRERDSFLLDCGLLYRKMGWTQKHPINVRTSCLEIGRRLRNA